MFGETETEDSCFLVVRRAEVYRVEVCVPLVVDALGRFW
jgi:hypothetical protein